MIGVVKVSVVLIVSEFSEMGGCPKWRVVFEVGGS